MPIRHGTEAGANRHRKRGEKPCDACRIGEIREQRARRITSGRQTNVKLPVAVLADLLDSCTPDARQYVVEVLSETVVNACIERAKRVA